MEATRDPAISADLRSDMTDFGASCFHSASTVAGNANAALEGGV